MLCWCSQLSAFTKDLNASEYEHFMFVVKTEGYLVHRGFVPNRALIYQITWHYHGLEAWSNVVIHPPLCFICLIFHHSVLQAWGKMALSPMWWDRLVQKIWYHPYKRATFREFLVIMACLIIHNRSSHGEWVAWGDEKPHIPLVIVQLQW